jgi:hypothetical protein
VPGTYRHRNYPITPKTDRVTKSVVMSSPDHSTYSGLSARLLTVSYFLVLTCIVMSGKGKGRAAASAVIARDFENGGSPQTPGE